MAVVQTFNQDDDNKDKQPQSGQAGAPVAIGGDAQGPSTGAGQGQGSSTQSNSYNAQAPTSSGRFTNLQSYLDANKGYNAQNGGLAGQIQSNLSGQAKNIQDSAGTAAQQFQSGADANRIKYNEDAVNSAISNPYQYLNGGAQQPGAVVQGSSPTDPTQANLDAFTKMRDAAYTPTDTNLQPYINQASQFQSTANLAGSEPGRYALLKNLYGGSGYNGGQQKLDNLLLQGNQDQLQSLNGIPALGANLNTNINNQLNTENGLNTQYGQEATDTQSKTRAALAGAVDPMVQQALAGQKSAQSGYDAAKTQAQQELKNGTISQADAAKFGLTANTPLFGMSPEQLSSYLTLGTASATPQSTLSQDQYNNFQALSKLAGNSLSGSDVNDPLAKAGAALQPYLGASQVGQFSQQNPFTFNSDRFQQDVSNNKNNYLNDLSAAYKYMPGLFGKTGGPSTGNSTTELVRNLADVEDTLHKYQARPTGVGQGYTDIANQTIKALQDVMNKYGINPANIPHGTTDPYAGIGSLNLAGSPGNNPQNGAETGTGIEGAGNKTPGTSPILAKPKPKWTPPKGAVPYPERS